MDFALTSEQELLRDSARALLAAECPTTLVRAHMDSLAAAAPLWAHLAEFSALGVGPVVDLCIFMEELGYVCAPSPFFGSAVLALPVLEAVGSDLVESVMTGASTATLALAGPEGIWVLNDGPFKSFVPDAEIADVVLAVDGSGVVSRLEAPELHRLETIDPSRPLYDVRTDGVASVVGPVAPAALERVDRGARPSRSRPSRWAPRAGSSRWRSSTRRAGCSSVCPSDRSRPSSTSWPTSASTWSAAWSAVYYAAMTLDADDADRGRAVHVAKAAAGEAAKHSAKDGIQIHGGIGYTWEHDLHLFMRRAFGTEALLGTTGWHHDRLADVLMR